MGEPIRFEKSYEDWAFAPPDYIIGSLDSDVVSTKRLEVCAAQLKEGIISDNKLEKWREHVMWSVKNLQRMYFHVRPEADLNEQHRKRLVNEILLGATEFLRVEYGQWFNIETEVETEFDMENRPPYITGWDKRHYLIGHTVLHVAEEGNDLMSGEGDMRVEAARSSVGSVSTASVGETKRETKVSTNAVAQTISQIKDIVEVQGRQQDATFPLVANGCLTTGHRFYFFTVTKFDVDNVRKPLVEYHGCAPMKGLRQLAPENDIASDFEMEKDSKGPSHTVDIDEVEYVLLSAMAMIQGKIKHVEGVV